MKLDSVNQDNITIPDGLEQRLSATIDGWEGAENKRRRNRIMLVASACVIALVGVFAVLTIFNTADMMPETVQTDAIADTYTNPEDAARAINYAMQMLQQSFDQSFAELEQVNDDFGEMKGAVISL